MYAPVTGPLTISGVFRESYHLLRAGLPGALILSIILSLLTNVPSALLVLLVEQPGEMTLLMDGVVITCLLLALLVHGALISLFSAVATGGDAGMQAACRVAGRRYPQVLGCLIAYSLIVLLGFVALVLPGIIFTVSLLFANFLVVTGEFPVKRALRRSHQLVWGQWWRISVMLNLLFLLCFAIFALVGLIAGMAVYLLADTADTTSLIIFVIVVVVPTISALLTPIIYACGLVILRDLQLRAKLRD